MIMTTAQIVAEAIDRAADAVVRSCADRDSWVRANLIPDDKTKEQVGAQCYMSTVLACPQLGEGSLLINCMINDSVNVIIGKNSILRNVVFDRSSSGSTNRNCYMTICIGDNCILDNVRVVNQGYGIEPIDLKIGDASKLIGCSFSLNTGSHVALGSKGRIFYSDFQTGKWYTRQRWTSTKNEVLTIGDEFLIADSSISSLNNSTMKIGKRLQMLTTKIGIEYEDRSGKELLETIAQEMDGRMIHVPSTSVMFLARDRGIIGDDLHISGNVYFHTATTGIGDNVTIAGPRTCNDTGLSNTGCMIKVRNLNIENKGTIDAAVDHWDSRWRTAEVQRQSNAITIESRGTLVIPEQTALFSCARSLRVPSGQTIEI